MTRDTTRSQPRSPANDVLDYAITIGIIITATVTTLLIALGTPIILTVVTMSVFGGVWTFTITPHAVAYWLDHDIDDLLDTPA